MSTLTKVCVVVLAVLILVSCSVIITAATVFPNYRDLYQNEASQRKIAEQQAQVGDVALKATVQERDEMTSKYNALLADKNASAQQAHAEITRLQSVNDEQANKLAAIAGELEKLRLSHEQNVQLRIQLSGNLDQARKTIDQLNEENRRTTEALKLSQANGDRQEKLVNLLREQMAEREDRIRTLEQQVCTTPARTTETTAAAVQTGANITGTINALRNDLANINVGSSQGVKQGMRFYIYRGDRFVGFLRIDNVTPSDAAGVVIEKKMAVMIGDKVATTLKS